MIKLQSYVELYADYDDGGGNSGDYILVVGDYGDMVDFTIAESRFYRPKWFSLLPPATEQTYVLLLNNTDAGSPPANISIVITTAGRIVPADSEVIRVYVKHKVKIITVDFEAIHDAERSQTLVITPPFVLSENGRHSAKNLTTFLVGQTNINFWANNEDFVDGDYELTAGFGDIDDEVTLCYIWDMVNILPEQWPNIQDIVIIIVDTVLLNTDYHTGKLIEQTAELLINYLGLSDGKYGTLVGSFMEYQADGEFGDLDLPLEVFQARCPAA
jgi:hypothetical protein